MCFPVHEKKSNVIYSLRPKTNKKIHSVDVYTFGRFNKDTLTGRKSNIFTKTESDLALISCSSAKLFDSCGI